MENNQKRIVVAFAAIDPYIQSAIVAPTEKAMRGKDIVEWGDRNAYPDYLLDLTKSVPSLRSVIGGTTDFIVGDDISILPLDAEGLPNIMNHRGDNIRSQVTDIARDFMTYGGFALQVIRDIAGRPAEIYYIDLRYLRSNKDNSVFYYSEKWGEGRRNDVIVYPAYQHITPERWAQLEQEERDRNASSIVYVKNITTQVYPFPVYGAAVKACEIERAIDDYHLNALENNFEPSAIINFNNGMPSDEERKEIEKDVNEKFAGHQNARRIMLSFNSDRENATTFEYPKTESFGEQYNALAKHSRQQIFTAFRANPNLFGIPTENLGFSSEEYESAFKLYNRTCVKPVQRLIADTYDMIYASTGVLTIQPFTIEGAAETQVQ